MIVVTGGAGFIGSRLVRALADRGADVLVVESFDGGDRQHLAGIDIVEVVGPVEFLARFADLAPTIEAVFHQGAITDTTCDDQALLAERNVRFSIALGHQAAARHVPFVYASSASVYGPAAFGPVDDRIPAPLNPYAVSKLEVDRALLPVMAEASTAFVGLRYYNVYGPGEGHKGPMASIVHQAVGQLRADGIIRLFDGCPDAGAGSIRRDWVHVDDIVAVNLAMIEGAAHGIVDVGTGHAETFETVAGHVIAAFGSGTIEHVPFPDHLRDRYQHHTVADLTALRSLGVDTEFTTIEEGVPPYAEALLDGSAV